MLLRSIFFFITFFVSVNSIAQQARVFGKIVDDVSDQPVVGARIILNPQFRAISDPDGNYEILNVPFGIYTFTITMPSFDTIRETVEVDVIEFQHDVVLGGSTELEEVKVIGNLVNDRRTPVAVTKISTQKITEELGSRDLPMLLNGTPGIYATQTGGGDGDSRINVRGFDQRNVGVLIDGVPVNDMENGWVYWSNWFGLDNITSTVQVQRGLGATKLAMPSVGGTINILTQGVGNRKGFTFKQEYGTGDLLRSSVSYNSGMMKSGTGITASASYKQGDGWVYGTPTQGFFGYIKVQQRIKSHLLSFSAFSAPQKHGQRAYQQPIQFWDENYAVDQGVTLDTNMYYSDLGIRFNQHWGYRTVDGKKVVENERMNYYNKPQITLKDFWKVNDKFSISNIVYVSIGKGGGTRLSNSAILRDSTGLIDWDEIVYNNQVNSVFNIPNTDPLYDPVKLKSSQTIISSRNDHFWVGYLGQFDYKLNKKIKLSGGLDYRYYKGTHYQVIDDLLGGDYTIETSNQNEASPMKVVGDKIALKPYNNHRDGLVNWAGAFGTMEYSDSRFSYFVNLSTVVNGYKGIDYFQKKVLDLGDTTLRIGAKDTISYNGQTYTASSPGLEYFQTDWKYIPGMTAKVGGSYLLTEYSTVFVNLGYLSRTPQFSNVIDNNTNTFFEEIVNEKIQAFEAGYSFSNKKFGINVNGYLTNWQNKPIPFGVMVLDPLDPENKVFLNINGMDALHMGGEIDFAYQIHKKVSTEFMFSLGDWRWKSKETVYIPEFDYTFTFDAKDVHVGDAAQTAIAASIRYEPIKNLYFKVQAQFFDRYYAQFDPFSLKDAKAGHDSWKLPSYSLVNLFGGYRIDLKTFDVLLNGSITNLLNSVFITDATDNQQAPGNFDAQSAYVMFGGGFRFNVSAAVQF